MSRFLVTGAGGYIGTHVVRALLESGDDVVAVHRGNKQIDPRAEPWVGDFADLDPAALKAMGPIDAVLHLAWSDGFSHDAASHFNHLAAHFNFVNATLEAGIKQFVGFGTMHEVGYWEGMIDQDTPNAPRSLYGIAKNALREATKLQVTKAGAIFQWLRAYYILGDDLRNKSLFSKILGWESEGRETFPFNSGLNKYDFIDVADLAYQIACVARQTEVQGIIDCCSGEPVALRDKVEAFIAEKRLKIRPEYGAFPDRAYDSPQVWGSAEKITTILASFPAKRV